MRQQAEWWSPTGGRTNHPLPIRSWPLRYRRLQGLSVTIPVITADGGFSFLAAWSWCFLVSRGDSAFAPRLLPPVAGLAPMPG
ncbi:uncharacterized protein BO80DRAFT_202974 [Aspergillus ibericus CBS 121593]|uniref:Uncharacterized protein n=1 Tax=Aspergillus ibericus CBS 121593 TaxID=1448316 RepID=A0A395H9A0_9EURO|nr:hypothetical protein BO80DRAFT_202974 [Aspergillus ibericus CBS 121593]RAL04531.1 hypothetical protein BO80DRAFT_202974 [Aspergillus ibericus CBS 121593]